MKKLFLSLNFMHLQRRLKEVYLQLEKSPKMNEMFLVYYREVALYKKIEAVNE
jgi:hypothetical protein